MCHVSSFEDATSQNRFPLLQFAEKEQIEKQECVTAPKIACTVHKSHLLTHPKLDLDFL